MKKIVLVSTFCDTEEKQNVFKDTVLKVKELGLDVMAIAPNFIQIKQEIIDLCDFFFYTKENPLLKWPIRAYTHWYEKPIGNNKLIMFHRGFADYGWAALYQVKKLSQLALTFDYDIFYHIIYDLEIDDVIVEELKGNEVNLLHPRKNPNNENELWETTLHFMVFNRDMMQKIENEITLENYLHESGFAEGEVLKWTKKYPLKISDHPIKDKIFYWKGFEFFNMSPFNEFKMFISKNEKTLHENYSLGWIELTDNLRICFHSFTEMSQIEIEINGIKFVESPKEWEYIEFPISSQDIKSIIFRYDGVEVDYTKKYEDISMNQIYYNQR
jgi:hypothetical protein